MKRFHETKLFRQFLPFMILIIGGSFFIQEFTKLKYKYSKVTSQDFKMEMKKKGIEMKKSSTLEEEYEKIKILDIDNWENVRIPRPWEEPNSPNN
ncbi:cytochrome c oxidase assembly protein COX16, mitochondrial [Apis mellifera caucasica]|uniref:Cytochrome c oxidase assembly protein COX16 homolog, mitochondrial n=1 Tax=Apis mellifera TaxID=7460 RepID=A0A7M7SRT3_APIME|nr:cytochrome c oxidase assembly protein COX16 homolog, mitochondrial [Apis mellifera]KAG6795469.1 cytochrome c oxidase assembly protein COX16, mitochondrial [Apis mellifera caucasica]KAG9438187.1 cytochrome c oxidase assembly protein COX16, mitochondrial [Apis mellifera carnica]|eukprot:XP_026300987.1 cytochrome c oxidase assembly protein COX16 homolog, mitochondrial [Apis mellifera]